MDAPAALAAIEPSPAFQSRGSDYVAISVAERQLSLIDELNRRSATEVGCAIIVPALKSRARLTWSLRDRENGCRIYFSEAINPRLYQVKFKYHLEGGKHGKTKRACTAEHINSNQTEHPRHLG